MMNFTSSVSDLECLLLKFKASQDFSNTLKVANILDVVVSKFLISLCQYCLHILFSTTVCLSFIDVLICIVLYFSILEIKIQP